MTPERWQQVKAILADALECASPAERRALVEQACAADVQLKEEVEALLAFDDCSEPFLGSTAAMKSVGRGR